VRFDLAADVTHTVCQSYGVEHPVAGVAFRAAFIIDNRGMVRSEIVNDLPIGRNIDELIRVIDAVQFFEEKGEVCPAGWQKGKAGMKASPKGVAAYLADHAASL
jgi:peroxiredoxin (alkyl hydroperoxide reductase subunit C)